MSNAGINSIAAHLTSEGVAGGSTGWTIAKGRTGDRPKEILIMNAPGPEPLHQAEREVPNSRYQLQVRGNTGDDKTTSDKAEEVHAALNRATIAGFFHIYATQSDPLNIGPDDSGRPLLSVDLRTQGA